MMPTFNPGRMTRSEAFCRACERNLLRREARLPLLAMSEAVAEELRRDAIRVHYAAAEHYQSEYESIKARVIADVRDERGDAPMSVARSWVVTLRSNREFSAFLTANGFPLPQPSMIVYGSDKAKDASSGEIDFAVLDQLSF